MMRTTHPVETGRDAASSVRRLVNDEILNAASRYDDETAVFVFVCECGNLKCRDLVKMTQADYRATKPGTVVAHG
jgi:hypothetical protein